jgi:hypothetical protein
MMIDLWERFLKSLETDGGRMVVLITMIAFSMGIAIFMTMTGHGLQETAKTLLATAIGSLLGILYGYLQRGGGNIKPPE